MAAQNVLVAGATGAQGGAVVRALRARGVAVVALVRDPLSGSACALADLGCEVRTGDLNELESLRTALNGIRHVFSVQAADLMHPDPATEVRQGINLADAAHQAQVDHFVYSSVAAVGRASRVQHFESKERIEAHIDHLGLPATVVRPTFFMQNWEYMLPAVQDHRRVGRFPLLGNTALQMVCVEDLGHVVADVFASPAEFVGAKCSLAGDELNRDQIARIFSEVDGIPTQLGEQNPAELAGDAPEVAKMFSWFNRVGLDVDIAALRERFPYLKRLAQWRAG